MTQELRNLALDLRFTGRYATETEAEAALRRIKRNQEASFAMESLLDRLEKAEKDAERYRWLRDRYMAVDFDWQGQQAVIFTADDFPIATASCDETIDRAMEASK